MDRTTAECPEAIAAGAISLDGLSEPERANFLRHLDICPTCRGEVADLLSVVLQLDAIRPRGSATHNRTAIY